MELLMKQHIQASLLLFFFSFFNKGNIGGTDLKKLCMYVSLVLCLWLHMNSFSKV